MMKLVSSWSHYLDFQCNDCGETTHVDATLDFPSTVSCRSGKCRTFPKKLEGVAQGDRFVQIGVPTRSREAWQPSPA